MNPHTIYQVTGSRRYRGHDPGSEFTARLDEGAERRALVRGDIRVVERLLSVLPVKRGLPSGWADQRTTTEGSK